MKAELADHKGSPCISRRKSALVIWVSIENKIFSIVVPRIDNGVNQIFNRKLKYLKFEIFDFGMGQNNFFDKKDLCSFDRKQNFFSGTAWESILPHIFEY
jgi:hypothetical protein